ncbi:MAG: tetratricopeptide repeat protein, partial [Candidatus Amoebophilus sp.]
MIGASSISTNNQIQISNQQIKNIELIEKIKKQETSANMFLLAESLEQIGDYENAYDWYKSAYNKDNKGQIRALIKLANLELYFKIKDANPQHGVALLEEAANQGCSSAWSNLAILYTDGLSKNSQVIIEPNKSKALYYFERVAESGLALDFYNLGLAYLKLSDNEEDFQKGIKYLKNAAEKGHSSACLALGQLYGRVMLETSEAKPDYQKALLWYLAAFNKGCNKAPLRIGLLYESGKIKTRNIEEAQSEAFKWFKKASEKANSKAFFKVGAYLDKGWGTTVNKKQAEFYYNLAILSGSIDAIYYLAVLYIHGAKDVKKDHPKALKLLEDYVQKFCEAKGEIDEDAYNYIAMLYYKGENINHNEDKAIEYFALSFNKFNNGSAAYNIACIYKEYGKGTLKDIEFWLKKADKAGCTVATFMLGEYYLRVCNPQVRDKAIKCFERCYNDEPYACFYLAHFHFSNYIKPQDKEKAFALCKIAADNNVKEAFTLLGIFYNHGFGVARNEERALEYFNKAAKLNDGQAIRYIGMSFFKNKDPKKQAQALNLFKKAVACGDVYSNLYIGLCYKQGYGIKANRKKAFEYIKKAMDSGYPMPNYEYGLMCIEDKNYEEALVYLHKAEILEQSYYQLAEAYRLYKKDYNQAFNYYIKALEFGDKNAGIKLGYMYLFGNGVEPSACTAAEYFENNIEVLGNDQQDAQVFLFLGYYYSSGSFGVCDKVKGFEYMKKAAELNNIIAQNNLAFMYQEAEGVSKNIKQALYWFERCAQTSSEDAYNAALIYLDDKVSLYDIEKAKEYLELALNQNYTPAAAVLAKIYELEGKFSKAIELYE